MLPASQNSTLPCYLVNEPQWYFATAVTSWYDNGDSTTVFLQTNFFMYCKPIRSTYIYMHPYLVFLTDISRAVEIVKGAQHGGSWRGVDEERNSTLAEGGGWCKRPYKAMWTPFTLSVEILAQCSTVHNAQAHLHVHVHTHCLPFPNIRPH